MILVRVIIELDSIIRKVHTLQKSPTSSHETILTKKNQILFDSAMKERVRFVVEDQAGFFFFLGLRCRGRIYLVGTVNKRSPKNGFECLSKVSPFAKSNLPFVLASLDIYNITPVRFLALSVYPCIASFESQSGNFRLL